MSVNRWMSKQIMVYFYPGILLSNNKESITDIYNKLDGSSDIMLIKSMRESTYLMILCIWNYSMGKSNLLKKEIRTVVAWSEGRGQRIDWD